MPMAKGLVGLTCSYQNTYLHFTGLALSTILFGTHCSQYQAEGVT
ncbi:hypothetical protein [Flammeovirga sp. EKP202]|nr:hypothetical protein [Flammeovirga sp. EKP202]